METSKAQFRERFGENPRKDDLTILLPKQDDPTEQVWHAASGGCSRLHTVCCPSLPADDELLPLPLQIFVFFPEEVKVGVKTIKVGPCSLGPVRMRGMLLFAGPAIVYPRALFLLWMQLIAARMKQENVFRAIMVIAANLTPFAKQCLTSLMPKLHIEQFTENELLVNIMEHVLVRWIRVDGHVG